eukprot:8830283-Alexandrium_andersonii.AAC.1
MAQLPPSDLKSSPTALVARAARMDRRTTCHPAELPMCHQGLCAARALVSTSRARVSSLQVGCGAIDGSFCCS